VTSVGVVFPPQSGQRSWWSGTRLNTFDPSNLHSTSLRGGQWVSTAVPSVRLHIRHVSSAAKTVVTAEENSADPYTGSGMGMQFSFHLSRCRLGG